MGLRHREPASKASSSCQVVRPAGHDLVGNFLPAAAARAISAAQGAVVVVAPGTVVLVGGAARPPPSLQPHAGDTRVSRRDVLECPPGPAVVEGDGLKFR